MNTLTRLESVTNFTEFVKAFSQFGTEMVELAQLTGDRQADLKDERRRSQMGAARHVLERSTMMLLTSAKVYLFLYILSAKNNIHIIKYFYLNYNYNSKNIYMDIIIRYLIVFTLLPFSRLP